MSAITSPQVQLQRVQAIKNLRKSLEVCTPRIPELLHCSDFSLAQGEWVAFSQKAKRLIHVPVSQCSLGTRL